MRILLSWLQEYCDVKLTPEKIAEVLTQAGIEVDHIQYLKPSIQACAVKVEEVKLLEKGACAAQIFDGKTRRTVVCGAKNCRSSLITAYTFAPTKVVHGISSEGFLCSEKELGLSEYDDAIIELDCAVGTNLDTFFADVAFDITITPNLGHCLSVLGIARELSAFTNTPMKKKPWIDPEPFAKLQEQKDLVTVEDASLCPRYSALVVDDVSIGPSTTSMRIRLERCGIRSINNVVDITNYVSHELGQPLHAFDAAFVDHIVVRKSRPSEKLLFLDAQERILPENSIVIADSNKALALGGIMGGKESGVCDSTTKIVFESAYFAPSAIRKTSKQLGLQSDSSRRFERGCDQNITMNALSLAYSLLGHGKAVSKCDVGGKRAYKSIQCRLQRASDILGYEVSVNEAESAFTKLFLISSWNGQDTFTVQAPTFRHDLNEEIDLIEEIGRLVGLETEAVHRPVYSSSTQAHHPMYQFCKEVRNRLLSFQLQEVLTCDLISPKMAKVVEQDGLVSVLNPLSLEQSVMRSSLLAGILDCLGRNIAHQRRDFQVFEIGHVHFKEENKYQEPLCFAIMLSANARPHHFSLADREVDFFDLKGMLEVFFNTLGFTNFELRQSELATLHPGRQAKIFVAGVHVGIMGELHPTLTGQFEVDQRVYYAECDMQELLKLERKERKMQELALFPCSERDWTITLNKNVQMKTLLELIEQKKPDILESASIWALFEHEKLGKDCHNVTLHFVYRDRKKTVSQEEVDRAHNALVEQVGASFK